MKNVFSSIKALAAVRPITKDAGAVTSIVIDTLGYKSGMIVVSAGAATGTPDSFSVAAKVQECATSGGSYVDVSGAAITAITAANKSAQIALDALGGPGRMRYIKVVVTPAFVGGTTPAIAVDAICLLGHAEKEAVGNSSVSA